MSDNIDKNTGIPVELNKLVCIRRTSKARRGGRDFSFSATVVVGDGNGRVGCGSGSGKDVARAVQKANESARCNMVTINLCNKTLQHDVHGKFGATKVIMRPAADGTGIIAGGPMRAVFEVLGVENVLAKCIKSSNPFNVVKATILGLQSMVDPRDVAKKRGVSLNKIFLPQNVEATAGATHE